jgi:hypothetical protein
MAKFEGTAHIIAADTPYEAFAGGLNGAGPPAVRS